MSLGTCSLRRLGLAWQYGLHLRSHKTTSFVAVYGVNPPLSSLLCVQCRQLAPDSHQSLGTITPAVDPRDYTTRICNEEGWTTLNTM